MVQARKYERQDNTDCIWHMDYWSNCLWMLYNPNPNSYWEVVMKTLVITLTSGQKIIVGVLGNVDVSFNTNNSHNRIKDIKEIANDSMAIIPIDILVKVAGE